ncbi:NAD(P)-binding protein [Nocardioides sp. HDW12B]|uniref:NAD(P)/FAD-dependent oxidoreductase n=1 Tax=Nocardioides sp. HDW12B TaxID=2714939 RepID=UPI00140BF296|nr:FAD-dependent oxidoreductase [Nocardioides sp. HDW12B]QIK66024.1 NAD(P)-binding protein [Nocardioides sp. HDW12B]
MTTTPGSAVPERPTVAVVGAGVSGLSAAHALQATHRVTLLEVESRLGGHAHTHTVDLPGGSQVPVDSGFIVLNDRTYPGLRRLFADLGVATRPTEMSMSVTCAGCGLGYVGGRSARGIFAQKRRVVDPRFWRLLLSVRRFQKAALELLETGSDLSYGEFLEREGFNPFFVQHYALPIVSCVWSMGHEEALGYPAAYLFAFLRNHGFLVLRDAPTWHTVVGGSRAYVEAVAARLDVVRTDARVTGVTRTADGVRVETRAPDGSTDAATYDQVVVATHADTALEMLTEPTEDERRVLGAFGYSTNRTFLHRDESFLPAQHAVRASWNYRLDSCDAVEDRTRVSYWMNRLQGHPGQAPLVVTLNPGDDALPGEVIAEMSYQHPTYTTESVAAQHELPALNDGRVAFAGAYHGWGFHEDGCQAGLRAAASLGAVTPDLPPRDGDVLATRDERDDLVRAAR